MTSSKIALPSAVLVLRLVTLALLLASLVLISVDKFHVSDAEAILLDVQAKEITFKDVYAYRYVLAIAVAGCVYTLLQIPFAAVSIARRKTRIGGSEGVALLLICADVVFALVIATGAAAGYGYTGDAKRNADYTYHSWERFAAATGSLIPPEVTQLNTDIRRFFMLAFSSALLMLLAAACMALVIMISVYALVRR
ncbi:CASP-like protein 4D1 [Triticum dicoccoides]|uniref:CASP-like protein 4D1 n=1 Tax=Triticum dicoccoides TaxID=85692 RepID=UPI00188E2F51|nr:CASP-like protein 4D1 [Triticum dicoccoides]